MSAGAGAELAFAGPTALAARVRARELSPRELVELCLRRIEALDPQLNAFRVVRAAAALAEATELEGRALDAMPLAGVPFAVKDDAPLAGEATTYGSRAPAPPAPHDGRLVAALRAAGAIPIGVTNVPELMIFPWTASAANGITRNPWDPSRTPGGSSGGSAAAVAAGLVPFATAADGGGSIRIPAAATGLPGLKAGRRPEDEGWLGLAVSGTLARTVADTALLYGVTHGLRPEPVRALRIALSTRVPPGLIAPVGAEPRAALERIATVLQGLGHHVVPRDPAYGTAQLQFLQMWLRGVYEQSLALGDTSSGARGRTPLERSSAGMAAGGRYAVPPWRRARLLAARAAPTRRILALWDHFDVLLTPGLASTPIAAEGGYGRSAPVAVNLAGRFTPFTPVFNLTGQPAMAVPAGFTDDGLPLSVQLVGRPGAEGVLLGLAAQLEAAAPQVDRRPPVTSLIGRDSGPA